MSFDVIQSKSDSIPVKVKSEQTPQISERIPFLFESGIPRKRRRRGQPSLLRPFRHHFNKEKYGKFLRTFFEGKLWPPSALNPPEDQNSFSEFFWVTSI